MFVGEWDIKSTTKLAVKEAAQYREELISTAFPWSRTSEHAASTEQKTPAQQYIFDAVESIAVRCAAHFFPTATATLQTGETFADTTAIGDKSNTTVVNGEGATREGINSEAYSTIITDMHRAIAASWAPLLFTLITEDLPEATFSSSKSSNLVEKSILRSLDATGRQAVSYQANGMCLSFMSDGHHSVSRPHQLTLFFYLRVRYLMEKLLVRLTPKLLALATAIIGDTSASQPFSPTSASPVGQGVARMRRCERRLRRHLHHALYVNVILTRPFMDLKPKEALSLPTSYSPVVAVMAANEQATQYVLENRTLMGPGVGCLRLATTVNPSEKEPSVAFYSKHFNKDMPAVIVAPAQSFPFATGTIAADLYSSALHRLKRPRRDEKDDSFLFYFGENHSLAREDSSANPKCLGVTLFANDIEPSTGLRGHAFEPVHTAFDGLWELFWPSYSSSASRIDGVKGDWLVPEALQTPEVREAEEVMFSPEAVQGADENEEASDEVIDLTTQPLPTIPQTMDECLMFALAESLKELHQRQKLSVANTQQQQGKQQQKAIPQKQGRGKKGRDRVTTSSQQSSDPDQALKVPIISVVGLYLKRHSPRIPIELRPVALGGKDQATGETAPPADNNETSQPFEGSDDDEEEGEKKLSKAEKMAKRKAEKEAKLAEKKGGKSKGKGKNEKSSTTAATIDGGAVDGGSTPATTAEGSTIVDSMTKLAVNLDFKHSTFKKSTAFFKEMAAKTNSAFFTVPNENEIHVKFQKHLLNATSSSSEGEPPLDLLRDHKKRYGAFISRFHTPLLELEEERRVEEEFAAIGGVEDSSSGARGGGQETLEDEAKATVSSISQFYGFTNSVNDELKRILTGRWRPASEDATKQKNDEESSSNEDDTESEDYDDDDDDDEGRSVKSLLSAASQLSSVTSTPDPVALHPLIGSKGKPVYNKAALLRNLRYYVVKQGLFYGDDLPSDDEGEAQNVNSSAKKNTKPKNNNQQKATGGEAFPSLGSAAAANTSVGSAGGAPVWQRALLRREAERTRKESEEAAAAAAAEAETKAEAEAKKKESESNHKKEKKKGPPKVHLDELLTTTMRVSASDRVMDIAAFFQSVTWRLLMPQTRIAAQSPHRVKTLWIKTTLPTVLIKERKRQGNRTVVYVVGIDDFGLSLRALAQRWKKEMACSVACEGAPPALGHGTRMCLALTGKVADNVEASLLQLGIPPSCITSR